MSTLVTGTRPRFEAPGRGRRRQRPIPPAAAQAAAGAQAPPAEREAAPRIALALADARQRELIYRNRHEVYARELGQHRANVDGRLTDELDTHNVYLVATQADRLLGYVSVTLPGRNYSIDKYVEGDRLPVAFDNKLFEVRLLTVLRQHRGGPIAALLMYAALKWIAAQGGEQLIAIGRNEVMPLYRKVGMRTLGIEVHCGAVRFQCMSASVGELIERSTRFDERLVRLLARTDWRVPLGRAGAANEAECPTQVAPASDISSGGPTLTPALSLRGRGGGVCYHGGAFFEAIGDEFDALDRRERIVNADVLDAWFDPSPKVIEALNEHLSWLLRTSPPTNCDGMRRAIARARGVAADNILVGAGSSDLIYLALRSWLTKNSRVLILDPMYGEYAHVLEKVIGCHVDRLPLLREERYQLDLDRLESALDPSCDRMYDMVILVNPNSPTGQHVGRSRLENMLRRQSGRTRFWIDETYIEYVDAGQSLETFAAGSDNVVICKSMSKVYALSGVRAAYLCGPGNLINQLTPLNPPWAVSLPAQVAAVSALKDSEYYELCYAQTHALRRDLMRRLSAIAGIEIIAGSANFVMCHLPTSGPTAAQVVAACREMDVFVRDVGNMGTQLGQHALRVAVKDQKSNERVVAALLRVLGVAREITEISNRPAPLPASPHGGGAEANSRKEMTR